MTQFCHALANQQSGQDCRSELTQGIKHLVQVAQRVAAFNQGLDALVGGADSLGNLIHLLRLDNGLEIILEQFGEVV